MKTASTVSGQTVIGGFRVLERIEGGAGSQGSVVKAVCVEDVHGIVKKGTVVALKIMHVSDEDDILWEKLQKRTRELCSLKSDNIVRYYGCFKAQQDIALVHVIVQE